MAHGAPGRVVTIVASVLAAAMVLPAGAHASVASRTGDQITITAGAGEANDVTIEVLNFAYVRVTDTAGVTPAGDCQPIDPPSDTAVDCGQSQFPAVTVSLGDGNDTFRTHNNAEFGLFDVDGGPGDDDIIDIGHGVAHGGDGNDVVGGSSSDDKVYGDAGDDTVRGFAGADYVDGGPGRDLIEGDTGIYSDGGSDTINSRDGEADRVTCGYGTDAVTADSLDTVENGGECESVDVSPVSGPDVGTPFSVGLSAQATGKIAKLVSPKGFAFRVTVSDACTGTGKLSVGAAQAKKLGLGRRAVTLVTENAEISAAGTYSAKLRPAAKYRAALGRAHRVQAIVTFACAAAGVTKRATRNVTFQRP